MSILTAPQSSSRATHVDRLGDYVALGGDAREILGLRRADGSVLVVDSLRGTLSDARLLARLAPQEPRENARIVCELYLADETRGRCRLLSAHDLHPSTQAEPASALECEAPTRMPLFDARGWLYCIRAVARGNPPRELCWTRCVSSPAGVDIVTLREVVGSLEDYEPARTATARELARREGDEHLSTRCLAAELDRLRSSAIVLNRGLREAVGRRVVSGELTLSEIALRCGRTKRDRRGTISGETSWLTRRIGVAPDGGEAHPTPWIHTDTLALIARAGLGLSPNEVEL